MKNRTEALKVIAEFAKSGQVKLAMAVSDWLAGRTEEQSEEHLKRVVRRILDASPGASDTVSYQPI